MVNGSAVIATVAITKIRTEIGGGIGLATRMGIRIAHVVMIVMMVMATTAAITVTEVMATTAAITATEVMATTAATTTATRLD